MCWTPPEMVEVFEANYRYSQSEKVIISDVYQIEHLCRLLALDEMRTTSCHSVPDLSMGDVGIDTVPL